MAAVGQTRSCDLSPTVLQRGASSVYFATYRIGHRHPARVELGELGWPRRQDQATPTSGCYSGPEAPSRTPRLDLAQQEDVSAEEVELVLADQLGSARPQ